MTPSSKKQPDWTMRVVVATLAFIGCGVIFFFSSRTQQWRIASLSAIFAFALIPWASKAGPAKQCLLESIAMVAGCFSGILSTFAFLALVHGGWLGNLFSDKEAGLAGLMMFGCAGFMLGLSITVRILPTLSFQNTPIVAKKIKRQRE